MPAVVRAQDVVVIKVPSSHGGGDTYENRVDKPHKNLGGAMAA